MTKEAFIKQAKEKGLNIKFNHVKRNIPLRDLCGKIKIKKDIPMSELLSCR